MNMHISFLLQLYRILASKLYTALPMENMNEIMSHPELFILLRPFEERKK